MRTMLGALSLAVLLAACDSDTLDLASIQNGSLNNVSLADGVNAPPAATSGPTALRVSSRLLSTDANAEEADIQLSYQVDAQLAPAITRNTLIRVDLYDGEGNKRLLTRARVSADQLSDAITVTVPVTDGKGAISLGLQGLSSAVVTDLPTYSTIALPNVLRRDDTDLSKITSYDAQLVPDSYSSAIEGNRRIHRFAVRVEGTAEGIDKPISITGLERHVARYFNVRENGLRDIESPVRVDFAEENIAVHLVMDVSSSMVHSEAAHDLLDSVSRTVIALARVANFDLRVFASDVYELNSLRDIQFDDLDDSGTALYRALDTALDDIDSQGDSQQDTIIIAFTDGRDFASRNYYPAFRSHEQVREYIEQRLRNVASVQREYYGRRMDSWFVSLGSNVDTDALESLASAAGGQYLPSYSNTDIEKSFGFLTDNIRGVYYLEYSSQQTPDDTELTLEVAIGDLEPVVVSLPNNSAASTSID